MATKSCYNTRSSSSSYYRSLRRRFDHWIDRFSLVFTLVVLMVALVFAGLSWLPQYKVSVVKLEVGIPAAYGNKVENDIRHIQNLGADGIEEFVLTDVVTYLQDNVDSISFAKSRVEIHSPYSIIRSRGFSQGWKDSYIKLCGGRWRKSNDEEVNDQETKDENLAVITLVIAAKGVHGLPRPTTNTTDPEEIRIALQKLRSVADPSKIEAFDVFCKGTNQGTWPSLAFWWRKASSKFEAVGGYFYQMI